MTSTRTEWRTVSMWDWQVNVLKMSHLRLYRKFKRENLSRCCNSYPVCSSFAKLCSELVEKTLDKSDAKLKPITIWSPAFPAFQVSRVLIWALVGALLYFPEFWLAVVSALIWFEKLNRKPLYSSSSKTLNHKPEISWVEKLSKRERDFNTYPPSKTKFIYPKSSAGFLTRLNLRQVCFCQWRIAARARLLPILS